MKGNNLWMYLETEQWPKQPWAHALSTLSTFISAAENETEGSPNHMRLKNLDKFIKKIIGFCLGRKSSSSRGRSGKRRNSGSPELEAQVEVS